MAHILVVDDERSIRNKLKEILEFEKFTVETAEDGPTGLTKIKEGSYDVLGLDGVLTMEAWGPNLALPGAAITIKNVDESRFWGNLKAPTTKVKPVM